MIYKLSPSELTYLYEGCKFCFWLKIRHGISQPSMPMPGIFSTIAGLQKGFYDNKRTETFCPELPKGVVHLGEEWVQSAPIGFEGMADRCYIKGRFDCVVKFDDGTYGVIDFKTAKSSEQKAEMYSRQLQAYSYALEHADNGQTSLSPVSRLGLLFFEPEGFSQVDETRQAFNGRIQWVEVARNDAKFMDFLKQVMETVASKTPPPPAGDCNWCLYRGKMGNLNLNAVAGDPIQAVAAESPLCPRCSGPMRLRDGKFGKFWSCEKYPQCRGTRNS